MRNEAKTGVIKLALGVILCTSALLATFERLPYDITVMVMLGAFFLYTLADL